MLAIIKVLVVFVIILILIKKKCPIGWAMLISSFILGLLFAISPREILKIFASASISPLCLELIAIMMLILILSRVLQEGGGFERIVGSLKKLIKDTRLILASVPALIGLLPMIGGAIFSAPLVKAAAEKAGITPAKKAFINYWFRHIFEYTWPLYPGLILAAKLADVDIWRIILVQIPLTLAAVGAGILFELKNIHPRSHDNHTLKKRFLLFRELALDTIPITSVILLVLVFRVHLAIALAISLFSAFIINRMGFKRSVGLFFKGLSFQYVILIVGIMVFRQMLEAAGATSTFVPSLMNFGVPFWVLVCIAPFLIGFISGVTVAFVGITFPVLLPSFGEGPAVLNYIMLAFASGYAGVLLSPVHVCLVLTKNYFKVDIRDFYRLLLLPVLAVLLTAAVIFIVR